MSENLLVINVDIREIRVALIEQGILTELHIERLSSRSTLGNVYFGKVSRVLPGMQAAFIDIGQERAAFLHVEDLIRPDDFEAYLTATREAAHSRQAREEEEEEAPAAAGDDDRAGADRAARDSDAAGDSEAPGHSEAPGDSEAPGAHTRAAVEDDDGDVEVDVDEDYEGDDVDDGDGDDGDADEGGGDDDDPAEPEEDEARADADQRGEPAVADGGDDDDAEAEAADTDAAEAEAAEAEAAEAEAAADASDDADDDAGDDGDEEGDGDTVEVELEAPDAAVAAPRDEDAGRRRGRTRRLTTHRRAERADEGGDEADIAYTETPLEDFGAAKGRGDEPDGETAPAEDAEGALEGDDRGQRRGRRRRRRARVARTEANDRPRADERNGQPPGERNGAKRMGTSHAAPIPRSAGRKVRGQRRSDDRAERDARGRRSAKKRGRTNQRQEKSRISKSTPIRDVVREGQQVIVQVTKEPIGSKGARVSSHISLPGRYVVYLPTVEHVGISKRIGSDKERSRLRDVIESVKPPTGGLVVRTMAEGLTKKQLKNDIGYLVRLWDEIARKKDEAQQTRASSGPALLYEELDLILKTARDLFTEDVARIVIDNREQYGRLRRFVEMFMPERARDVHLYEGAEPIFDAYGIEDEIARALSRKVPLASGGYLIIDQAEALTAIDVNTGRYVGKGSKDLEETILQTNLEAVEEIAYQLRFRNIGGLIILDLIDMDRAANREKVRRRLEALLAKDKAKTTFNRISELGLIEMTRKRTRESLGRLLHEPCFYCDGTGQLMSRETIAYEILRQIRREQSHLKGYKITVNAHPAIIDLLKTEERDAVAEVERMFARRIDLVPRKEYHIEQFDLQGL
jgi:ribonuclease G